MCENKEETMDTMTTEFLDGVNDVPSTSVVTKEPECNNAESKLIPIVYTTRLDDMLIFKTKLPDMRIYDIVDCITTESHPKYNGKLKRKYSETQDMSFERLSHKIDKMNRKVARTATRNKTLLSMCKPFNVVLEDCGKRAIQTDASTHVKKTNINMPKRITVPTYVDKLLPIHSKSNTFKCRLLYDSQLKVAEIYSLDDNYFTKEYIRIHNINQNDEDFRKLRTYKNMYEVTCCCWYNRETFIKKLALHPYETLKFMRKPHQCPINNCHCCCRNKDKFPRRTSSVATTLQNTEEASIWFNEIKRTLASKPINDVQGPKLITKSLSVDPKLRRINTEKQIDEKVVHSVNIYVGEEYYGIGEDGQVKIHLKNFSKEASKRKLFTDKELKYSSSDVCCWYKREKLAVHLLKLGVLPSAVNFIRRIHPCPRRECKCCCKPSIQRTVNLNSTQVTTRHTNDWASKEVGIKMQFLIAKRHSQVNRTTISDKNAVVPMLRCVVPICVDRLASKVPNPELSFYVSLSVLSTVSDTKMAVSFESLLPESNTTMDSQNNLSYPTVRVMIIKEGVKLRKYKVIIEGVDLNKATTKELQMLDLIFRAVDKNINMIRRWVKKKDKPPSQRAPPPTPTRVRSVPRRLQERFVNEDIVYPQLLNEQLRIAADLKSKRFVPSLELHLDKLDNPFMNPPIDDWLDNE